MFKILSILILCNTLLKINCQKTWTFEVTAIEFETSDANFIDADLQIDRIARGDFGVSGFIDIKQPVNDSSLISAQIYRDTYCDGNFMKQPYSVSSLTLTRAMNKFYKEFLMDSLKDCAKEYPKFENFVPPLTARCIVFNKCKMSTDNLPSHVSEGCYKVALSVFGQVEASIEIFSFVEKVDVIKF